MTLTSRKTARKALAGLLKTALEGTGKLAQSVYAYPPRKWEGSPLVYVRSAGSGRKRRGIGQQKAINAFALEIVCAIAAANFDTLYTPEATEDLLDDLEAMAADTVTVNQVNAAWANIQLASDDDGQPSQIVRLGSDETGTLPYDIEIIPVVVTVFDT